MEWLKTKEGVDEVADLLGFELHPGKSDKEYVVEDAFGRESKVSHDEVVFLSAAIVKDNPVPIKAITTNEKKTDTCDLCSIHEYCVKQNDDPEGRGKVLACNHCLINNNSI